MKLVWKSFIYYRFLSHNGTLNLKSSGIFVDSIYLYVQGVIKPPSVTSAHTLELPVPDIAI